MSNAEHFGEFLRVARNACQLTQEALAQSVQLDHTYISKLERGKAPPPSISTLQRMAAVLRVPPTLMCNVAGRIDHDLDRREVERLLIAVTEERDALSAELDRQISRTARAQCELGKALKERDVLAAELARLHTLDGIIEALSVHYPETIFPTLWPDDPGRDDGARIVSLIRTVDTLAAGKRDLEGENECYRLALETIRGYGAVCAEFETCDHVSCRDSYSAWHVADATLRGTTSADTIQAGEDGE